jgi:hypothetical protein
MDQKMGADQIFLYFSTAWKNFLGHYQLKFEGILTDIKMPKLRGMVDC